MAEPRSGRRPGQHAAGLGAPLLLPLPGFEPLARSLYGVEVGPPAVERFDNGEIEVRVPESVANRSCILLGTAAPPGDRLVELLLAADTLLRSGARSLHALLPYLAYARQDHPSPGTSLAAAWLGRILGASGIESLTTIDVHSDAARELIGMPLISLSPAELFASALAEHVTLDTVVVAPDQGALARAQAIADALGIDRPVASLVKERDSRGVTHTRVLGETAARAIVIDDILDTGGTLVSCCRRLRSLGVEETIIAVTHGLFTGSRWHELADLGVAAIHTTDSVPHVCARASRPAPTEASGLVHVHSVGPLLTRAVTPR